MGKDKQLEAALTISFLFVVITSIFSLSTRIISCIVIRTSLAKKIELFLFQNVLWILVVTGVIVVLRLFLIRTNHQNIGDILKDPVISLTTGLLVALDGLINLSRVLPEYVTSIMSSTQSARQMGNLAGSIIRRIVIGDAAAVFIILGQVIFGVYFMREYQKNGDYK